MQYDEANAHMYKIGSSCFQHYVKQVSVCTTLITVVCSMTKHVFICTRLTAVECFMTKQVALYMYKIDVSCMRHCVKVTIYTELK